MRVISLQVDIGNCGYSLFSWCQGIIFRQEVR
jgi:hypothetical protein